jgi:hypothetical protein
VESVEEPLDQTLRAALYVAKGDVDLRSEPFPGVGKRVRRRQRSEALAELPQAVQDLVNQRGQLRLGFEPYDPTIHDSPLPDSTISSVPRQSLDAELADLTPAERRAVLEALEADTQNVPLPRWWGDTYQRKIKAFNRYQAIQAGACLLNERPKWPRNVHWGSTPC